MNTITLGGREYKVERYTVESATGHQRQQYRLTGKRGAVYVTMRNQKTPEALFVQIGHTASAPCFWMTDMDGELVAVPDLNDVCWMLEQRRTASTPEAPAASPLDEVRRLERELAKAQRKSLEWAERRRLLPAGASRARSTTVNARWAQAAEHRDRLAAALERARERLAGAT